MSLLPTNATLDAGLKVYDLPESPLVVTFYDEAGGTAELDGVYDSVTVTLWEPNGDESEATLTATIEPNSDVHVDFTWPESPLDGPGIWQLRFTFETANTSTQSEPLRFVVELEDGWLTLEQTRQRWPDAPLDLTYLWNILKSAKIQCIDYAPALGIGDPVPANYLQAQLMQARAIFTSFIANQNDNIDGQFPVRVFPMDWNVKALLRPKTGLPKVG